MSRLLPDEIEKLSNYFNLQKQVAELTIRAEQAEAREKMLIEALKDIQNRIEQTCEKGSDMGDYYNTINFAYSTSIISLAKYREVKQSIKPSELCHTCRYDKKKCETIFDCVNGSGWKEIIRAEGKP